MKTTITPVTHPELYQLHDQIVQPITYLNAAMELWEQGLHEPEDFERMKDEVQRLVEVVRDLQAKMRSQKVALVVAA